MNHVVTLEYDELLTQEQSDYLKEQENKADE